MVTIIVFLTLLIVLDLAALRWGFDSSDSGEWQQRRAEKTFH